MSLNNVVCRMSFTINISVGWLGLWFPDGIALLLAMVEIYRWDDVAG